MVTVDIWAEPSNATEFHVWRARSIQSYADVEQSLCHLFGELLGAPPDYADVVFYRLTNTHSRNVILETLLAKRYGTKFQTYWHGAPNTPKRKGLLSLVRQLDQRRNEIVHWHTVNHLHVTDDGVQSSILDLLQPNFWTHRSENPRIDVAELQNFCARTGFVASSVNSFVMVVGGKIPAAEDTARTWLGIFQQPCTYPPPDNHPLSQTSSTPDTPPPPSGESPPG